MRKTFLSILSATTILFSIATTQAATLALPGVVFTAPPSTSIACTETAASNLVVPVASGTVIFNCTVSPSTWTGTVSLSGGAPFTLTAPIGNAFNVILSAAVTTPATDQPGTLTTSP